MRSDDEVRLALSLAEAGLNPCQIARRTGIPRPTVRDWIKKGPPGRHPEARPALIDPADVSPAAYAYLLGLYLGDGCISRSGRSWGLRIFMDASHPGIIEESRQAVATVLAPSRGSLQPSRVSNMVVIRGYSSSLPILFPQHGPGRKHERPIVLEPWQAGIVAERPDRFLRGLIHSDGCRVMNRVWGGKYAYPRYFFTQVSTDMTGLFCMACDQLGVEWRRWRAGRASRSSTSTSGRSVK